MRVAVNAEQLLYRSPGGIGRYTAQLLTLLPELYPGDSIVPFTAHHKRAAVESHLSAVGVPPTTSARAHVIPFPRPVLYEGWLTLGLPPLPSLDGAEVIHAPSVAVPPAGRRRLVVTVHDAAVELYPEAFPPRGRRFHRLGVAAAAKRADAVIAVSAAAADEIVARTPVRPEQVTVVHNGVRPPELEQSQVSSVLRAKGLAGRRYVLWVGSLEPRKGVGTLVAAMATLRRRLPALDVDTVLAGYDGWLGEGLVAADDRAALGDSLHQLGPLGDAELWPLYREATVFAFPSIHEGFGLPVVEAMSQATATVASDIPALREVAGNGAVLVAPGRSDLWAEALESLIADDAERERVGAQGLVRSRKFTAEAMIRATRDVYLKVGS